MTASERLAKSELPHTDGPPRGPEASIQEGVLVANRYLVERRIGEGAMGVLFLAHDVALDRAVALKTIHAELAREPAVVERLLIEARSASQIQSEHVTRVLDIGRGDDGKPFLVLEYLEGTDFHDLLATEGPLSMERAVDSILEAWEALAEAHAAGVIHRDLKPDNLFLARRADGTTSVKVLDFGISKRIGPLARSLALTAPSGLIGSPSYMAPEQIRGRAVDARTDVWALGATLYELLTGERAFDGELVTETCARALSDRHRPVREHRPEIPQALSDAIDLCLEKPPEARHPDIGALAAALAPFGTERALRSALRIHAVLRGAGGTTPVPPPPASPLESGSRLAERPESPAPDPRAIAHAVTVRRRHPSGRAGVRILLAVCVPAAIALGVGLLRVRTPAEEPVPERATAKAAEVSDLPAARPTAHPPTEQERNRKREAEAPSNEQAAPPEEATTMVVYNTRERARVAAVLDPHGRAPEPTEPEATDDGAAASRDGPWSVPGFGGRK